MSDHPECGLSYEQIQSIANKTNHHVRRLRNHMEVEK